MKIYDTIIVGGGPSGATAARCLARLGVDVLLLDKMSFPRQKPCGGALSPKTYGQVDFDISDLVKARVRRTRLRGPGRSRLLLQSREVEIWMVCREELDLRLLEQASQAGVMVKQREPVESVLEGGRIVRTTREEYRTRTLVGADGYGSLVAKALGLGNPRPRYFRSIHLECPV
ncbi:MAG: FAD-dependent monooxygenase, partial [Dehalococcoidia bacterium]|nr:FAD-dependent monooxygenase [Dehalococcoidia bacterium]